MRYLYLPGKCLTPRRKDAKNHPPESSPFVLRAFLCVFAPWREILSGVLLAALLAGSLASPASAVPPKHGWDWGSLVNGDRPIDRLIRVVSWGKVDAIRQELDRGTDINGRDYLGDFPLMYAISDRVPNEVLHLLLDRGAKIDAQTEKQGYTALHHAALMEYTEKVKLLLMRGATVDVFDTYGRTALYETLGSSNPEITRLLLEHGSKVNIADRDGRTPLMHAAEAGLQEKVRLLLERNANLDFQDKYGYTVLHRLVRDIPGVTGDQTEIFQTLLEKHPNLNLRNDRGYTALMMALENEQTKLAAMLEKAGADRKGTQDVRLFVAARKGDTATVQQLLAEGVNPNAGNRIGNNALAWAAMNNHLEVVKALVAKGADVNARSLYMNAPALMYAVDDPKIAKALLDAGTDVHVINDWGDNVFFCALSRGGHPEVIRMLLDRGFDANTPHKGMTPLMQAAKSGNEGAIGVLLERGADIKASDKEGNTALHHAVLRYEKVKEICAVLTVLLERGADINARNREGKTPLMLGMEKAHRLSAQDLLFLRERGAIGENTAPGKDDFEEPTQVE